MASTPEGKVKAAVRKILDNMGVYYFFPATGGYGRSGVADIVCCVRGHFLAIECKAKGGKLTALQEYEMKKVKWAGGTVFVATPDSLMQLPQLIQLLLTNQGAIQ